MPHGWFGQLTELYNQQQNESLTVGESHNRTWPSFIY